MNNNDTNEDSTNKKVINLSSYDPREDELSILGKGESSAALAEQSLKTKHLDLVRLAEQSLKTKHLDLVRLEDKNFGKRRSPI
jgi:hypothetical protein